MYTEIRENKYQYMNTCAFCAESDPYLSQDDTFALKSFSKKVYHEVYERFVKWEAGNYSVERDNDSDGLVRRHSARTESVPHIDPGEQCTCNVQYCFEEQYIHEYYADGGCILDKWNPQHLMVDTYYHSRELD